MEKKLRDTLANGKFQDVPEARSRTMAAIRGHGNRTTELCLRLMLVRAGIRGWKIQPATIDGHPDFLFPSHKVAIFVDGCYWHGCPSCGHVPKTNSIFWQTKLERNRQRDLNTTVRLQEAGFHVIRFWEHELRDPKSECVRTVLAVLTDSDSIVM